MPDIFGVISDATRRDIMQVLLERHLANEEVSVSEIVASLDTSQPTVSKHLKVLREVELVHVREEGQRRYYSLNTEPLEIIEDFVLPFLSAGVETEVTVEYVSDDGEQLEVDDEGALLSEATAARAEKIGRAAAIAGNQVKELVARFRLRA